MNLYEVLDVRRSATTAEIRRAYQKLARQLHPDLNPGDPQAVERFQAVSSAFEVLSDPQRRAAYDRGESVAVTSGIPEVGFHGFDFSAEVRLGGAGFQEIFGDILRRPAPPETEAARGEDLEQTARLAFEECFHDTRRRVHVVRQDRCPTCQGAGEVTLAPQPCPLSSRPLSRPSIFRVLCAPSDAWPRSQATSLRTRCSALLRATW